MDFSAWISIHVFLDYYITMQKISCLSLLIKFLFPKKNYEKVENFSLMAKLTNDIVKCQQKLIVEYRNWKYL